MTRHHTSNNANLILPMILLLFPLIIRLILLFESSLDNQSHLEGRLGYSYLIIAPLYHCFHGYCQIICSVVSLL